MFTLVALTVVVGVIAYGRLGRLENPDFIIKTAMVMTPYPGASPEEVEQEVSDVLEEAIQSMGQLKEVRSMSQEGLSVIYAEMQDRFEAGDLPQIWDELRRKINDAQGNLPPGAGPSVVNDDFSDVYGLFYAISGEGLSYEELRQYAKTLKKDLLGCKDVAKIDFWGEQPEVIFIEIEHSKLSQLGISPQQIMGVLRSQNVVERSGKVKVDDEYIRITPTGDFSSEAEIGNLLISDARGDAVIRLSDVAKVRRGYYDPPMTIMRRDGRPAIGLGISTVFGGNAVIMGEDVKRRMKELLPLRPEGIEVGTIYDQSDIVTEAVDGFVLNLAESVAIVILLLMLFMGWRSGLLIGVVLLLTIFATLITMWLTGIALQKISLGALILALGMLVDNAIVVAEGTLIGVQRGMSREAAAIDAVKKTQWPLLGATIVAILAFAAIGFAPGNVGEFCRSLFWVLAMSLMWSWVLAVTVTPLLCVLFLQIPEKASDDPYDTRFFKVYRAFLHKSLVRWPITLFSVLAALVVSIWAFQFIPEFFFAGSTQPYFYIDFWRPEGTHIEATSADLLKVEEFLGGLDGVEATTTFVGRGALRFMLSYDPKPPNTAFGQILVRVDDYEKIPGLKAKTAAFLRENFPDAEPQVRQFANGPPIDFGVEAQFRGPDGNVLHELTNKAKDVFIDAGGVTVRDDWRQRVKVFRPEFSEQVARRTGISRSDLAGALQTSFGGLPVGVYREEDDLLPIIVRTPEEQQDDFTRVRNVQVWSPTMRTVLPLAQVVDNIDHAEWEDPVVRREDRMRTMIAQCNSPPGELNSQLLARVRDKIEAIELPPGYQLEWEGEYKQSLKGKQPLAMMFPICLFAMFILLIFLFNSIREPVIIMLTVPLSIIGVTAGLLLLRLPFGFMAILGFLGLSGMLIKNAIVLIDQINIETSEGKTPYEAILASAVSRLRPVCMASGTTVLGMAPLVWDPFYSVMAATVASGLIAATVLTLVVVPLFFLLFFRVKPEQV